MLIKNNQQHYGLIAISLHWIIAIMTFTLFGLGLWMVELGYYDDWYKQAPTLHEGIGVFLFLFFLLRTLWRWLNTIPKPLISHKRWETTAASIVKFLLTIILLSIGISGYLIGTSRGDALAVFNLFSIPASLSGLPNQADLMGDIHWFLAWSLMFIISIHALAALKHHFVDKDNTLKRILGL